MVQHGPQDAIVLGVEDDIPESMSFSGDLNKSQERQHGESPHAQHPLGPAFTSVSPSLQLWKSIIFAQLTPLFSGLLNDWSTSKHSLITKRGNALDRVLSHCTVGVAPSFP